MDDMPREIGSQPTTVIKGGEHDGVLATVIGSISRDNRRYYIAKLPGGGIIEVAMELPHVSELPREVGS